MSKTIIKPIVGSTVVIKIKSVGPQGVAGAGAVWGGITGTLDSQADLKAAQDAQDAAIALRVLASGGTLVSVGEQIAAVHTVNTPGETVTLERSDGHIHIVQSPGLDFTLELGSSWSDTESNSITMLYELTGSTGTIPTVTYGTSFAFKTGHTPPPLDDLTADTGWAMVELFSVLLDDFAFQVGESV